MTACSYAKSTLTPHAPIPSGIGRQLIGDRRTGDAESKNLRTSRPQRFFRRSVPDGIDGPGYCIDRCLFSSLGALGRRCRELTWGNLPVLRILGREVSEVQREHCRKLSHMDHRVRYSNVSRVTRERTTTSLERPGTQHRGVKTDRVAAKVSRIVCHEKPVPSVLTGDERYT